MARSIDKDGKLIDPVKAPWKTGGAFTTPPGWWHSHVNETDEDAWVLPIQDAGLFTHQVSPQTAENAILSLPLHAASCLSLCNMALSSKASMLHEMLACCKVCVLAGRAWQ